MVSENVPTSSRGAPKLGSALLSGLLRCRRCGRKLSVQYTGAKGQIPRYACVRGRIDYGEPNCIAFGGLRVDDIVEAALLSVVQPGAIEAARAAESQASMRRDEAREAMMRDLEAARYTADRAFRQYDAADPENRLVTGELEARWNRALSRVSSCEARIAEHDAVTPRPALPPTALETLAADLQGVWSAPTTDARLKKRIVRTLIHEAIADLDEVRAEIVLTVHWVGGAHTEHRLPRRRRGQRTSTAADVIEAVRTLALIARDDVIAGVLNRNSVRTGHGTPIFQQTSSTEAPFSACLRAKAICSFVKRLRGMASTLLQGSGCPKNLRSARTSLLGQGQSARIPSTRRITRWLASDTARLSLDDRRFVESLRAIAPKLSVAAEHVRGFREILSHGDPADLEPWWAAAAPTDLRGFVAGLRQDQDAVRAAIAEPWSNGPVNRLKLIKRSMCGRASFDLLRQRVLHAA